MDATNDLLRQIVDLQRASIRLQKLSIALQAESLAYRRHAARADKPNPALDRLVMRAVREIRATADRVEAGRRLPR
jgi:hypothetical protein